PPCGTARGISSPVRGAFTSKSSANTWKHCSPRPAPRVSPKRPAKPSARAMPCCSSSAAPDGARRRDGKNDDRDEPREGSAQRLSPRLVLDPASRRNRHPVVGGGAERTHQDRMDPAVRGCPLAGGGGRLPLPVHFAGGLPVEPVAADPGHRFRIRG